MLRPSYAELMNDMNSSAENKNEITSRYSIVIAIAKRARQLTAGAEPLTTMKIDKAVSLSVREMSEGKLKIVDLK